MSGERIFGGHVGTNEKLQLLGPAFRRVWPVDEDGGFSRFLRRIDDALIQNRSHSRIARLDRMLERNYAG